MKNFTDSTLFRYRSVTDYSISELLFDDLVVSTLDTFNDPCDSTFGYDSFDYLKELIALKRSNEAFGDLLGVDYLEKQKTFLKSYFDLMLSKIITDFKKRLLVGCFTLIPNNPVMWSHYCNNRKGFVLAYSANDISNLLKAKYKTDEFVLLEVRYNDKTFVVTEDLKNCINSFTTIEGGRISMNLQESQTMFERNMLSKPQEYQEAFITKSKEWEYEHEVRFIRYDPTLRGDAHESIGKCRPKRIILGDRMSKKDRYLLLSIAKNKGIGAVELSASYDKSKFGLTLNGVPQKSIDYYLQNGFYNFELDSFDKPSSR